ncbi:hypothetical protein Pan241w_11040 [Gimesia alba]|uniref:Uncharacterized protein n=2 Tax=Gimesia alba TaxID=2527973 RepID=A0A517RAY6_9PLAN|nr:hypothetical protein Pan241w_11040 [Gimesia alba]
MQTTIEVEAKLIMAACEILDRGTSNSVDGVHFTRDSKGNLVVVATDGEGMVMYRSESPAPSFNFTIPTKLAKAVKGVKNKYRTAVITAEERGPGQDEKKTQKATVTFNGGTFEDVTLESLARLNGRYPDIADFVRRWREQGEPSGDPSWVRPAFIVKLAKSIRTADYLPAMMRLEHNGVDIAKIVIAKHINVKSPEPNFACLVKPMKRESTCESSDLLNDI